VAGGGQAGADGQKSAPDGPLGAALATAIIAELTQCSRAIAGDIARGADVSQACVVPHFANRC
jgi:hypothetical protein